MIIRFLLFFILFFFPSSLRAQEGGTGAGLMLGEPTGISLKTWISGRSAVDAGLAWSFYSEACHVHADYLWHNFNIFRTESGKLPLYMGLGGRVKTKGSDIYVGMRVPIGLTYICAGNRMDFFLEAVPVLNLIPSTDFDFNCAIGIRYFLLPKESLNQNTEYE